ncbi:MAG: hypothetical protein LUH51_05410 [Firmicutes bacterium]|nr:hypothetical protein [Bacillota bacterium]
MCRKNQLIGFSLAAAGIGAVAGCWMESKILCMLLGIGLIAAGVWVLCKR